jgi:sirohydrochlorin cobaltochelatase
LPTQDVLLLIGHGSARYPDAGSAMHRHATELRRHFAQVEVGLLNGSPSVADALTLIGAGQIGMRQIEAAASRAPIVRVVPFFMEDGYFSRVAVPRALAGTPALLCPPIGIHDGIAGLVERQALAACDHMLVPSRSAAVLIVGHGSSSAPGRALALHRHASRVAATELFARVEAACLEEPPFVADALCGLRAHPVVVIGFFANRGGHVRDDVPRLVAAEREARGKTGLAVRLHGSVSDDPAMVEIILDQAGPDPSGINQRRD